tara:strand:+ start:3395 stop:5260 length:1866 start_codon:yes stop_codon:yes gene_type:complete
MNSYDVIVCGGGHAGIEASLISLKLGCKTALVTMNKRAIGRMSCNPAIGGLSKGQIVKEMDILGGMMGVATDFSAIQFKILNQSKGKSVWSPRAQVDKRVYESFVLNKVVASGLDIIEGEVVDIIHKYENIEGIILRNGSKIEAKSVVLTCGTFLNGLIHIGQRKIRAGRMGESAADGITESLVKIGFKSGRLKTGTPPRINKNSVDWNSVKEVYGDKSAIPFSYRTKNFKPKNHPCHSIYTTSELKKIIEDNLDLSPMFSGDVNGVGPRYCPSIEDKIFKFKHHEKHNLFLEPEWNNSDQIYLNGFSTSLPEKIQLKALRSIPALKKVEFLRPGYAIEYDFFMPAQLKSTLESKKINNLYFAGQINGTSGYEEAAAQGLIAGINAANKIQNKKPLILKRNQAYIGVMIDDLITKDTLEPYRMFTSRAEYRILLRFSNCHSRLKKMGKEFDLLSSDGFKTIDLIIDTLNKMRASLNIKTSLEKINNILINKNDKLTSQSIPLSLLLKRPRINIEDLDDITKIKDLVPSKIKHLTRELMIETEAQIKYEGYIKRQIEHVKKMKKQEHIKIPSDFNFKNMSSISNESKEKLDFIKPENLGQAMRISGIKPSDISILSVYLSRR